MPRWVPLWLLAQYILLLVDLGDRLRNMPVSCSPRQPMAYKEEFGDLRSSYDLDTETLGPRSAASTKRSKSLVISVQVTDLDSRTSGAPIGYKHDMMTAPTGLKHDYGSRQGCPRPSTQGPLLGRSTSVPARKVGGSSIDLRDRSVPARAIGGSSVGVTSRSYQFLKMTRCSELRWASEPVIVFEMRGGPIKDDSHLGMRVERVQSFANEVGCWDEMHTT
ncbi:hypothetical protein BKA82DRAFT_6001 [Pisolithus tinctorius]|uniref:Uncharacterized protein n=1 Tax=Pisolithus tinctorius Marx 270 TaxID=870435 RepID=A0A0C3PZ49_PISTI|nr:hypothetical protein BKA82DRAFT_6001 [Pisolithus tinctorius]KIO15071.1 hypothetical protein M404DRAFT_6001 [Pisolithus tinctorius Marx 270]